MAKKQKTWRGNPRNVFEPHSVNPETGGTRKGATPSHTDCNNIDAVMFERNLLISLYK